MFSKYLGPSWTSLAISSLKPSNQWPGWKALMLEAEAKLPARNVPRPEKRDGKIFGEQVVVYFGDGEIWGSPPKKIVVYQFLNGSTTQNYRQKTTPTRSFESNFDR